MDQQSICLFLAKKGLSAGGGHNKRVAVLGLDAIAYSILTRYRRQRQFPAIFPEPSDEPPTIIIDDAILEALNKQPFSSVRELAKLTCIPTTAVHRHLTASLGSVLKHLRCLDSTNHPDEKRGKRQCSRHWRPASDSLGDREKLD
jgi:hypothetical protein